MPLTPIYTWSENETSLQITIDNVPIKDQSQLFCSDRLVKLNAPPYLLLLDLKAPVDDDRSTATVLRGRKVQFTLVKAEPGLWGSLTADGDKQTIKQHREASVKRTLDKQVAAQKQRLEQKNKEEKAAVDHQIAQERAQRARIEQLKQQELDAERQQLQQWQQQQGSQESKQQLLQDAGNESDYEDDITAADREHATAADAADAAGARPDGLQDSSSAVPDHADYYGKGWWPAKQQIANSAQHHEADDVCSTVLTTAAEGKAIGSEQQSSKCTNQQQMAEPELLTVSGSCSTPGHTCALGNLMSDAAAAASQGQTTALIEVSSSDDVAASPAGTQQGQLLTAVRSSRSRTSNKTATGSKAAAAQPSKPPAPVRFRSGPVAVTFTQLETPHLPAREQREVEFKQIKRHAKADSLDVSERQPAFLKDKGDGLAAQGNYQGAINAYTRAIELDRQQASLWSNRAACHLALGQAHECVQDCTAAVELLQQMHTQLVQTAGQPDAEQELLAATLPAAGASSTAATAVASEVDCATLLEGADASIVEQQLHKPQQSHQLQPHHAGEVMKGSSAAMLKVRKQLAKVLGRRAAAQVEMQKIQDAWDDLQQALRIDPDNLQLQADAFEVSALLNPTSSSDTATLKQRADARFKAGDMQGAAEAYTALIHVLQQPAGHKSADSGIEHLLEPQQQEKQYQEEERRAQMITALSNRAACWLSSEQYRKCVEDCHTALALALGMCTPAASAVHGTAEQPLTPHTTAVPDTADDSKTSQGTADVACHVEGAASGPHVAAENVQQCWERLQPEQLLTQPGAGPARVRSAARLFSRMAVAYGCLKHTQVAVQLYGCAQRFWLAAGDDKRAAEMATDQQRLLQLLPRCDGH